MIRGDEKEKEIRREELGRRHDGKEYHGKRKRPYESANDELNRIRDQLFAITAIIGVTLGLLFLSPNITGNVIGSGNGSANIVGVALLLIGIIAAFFYFRV